MRLLSLGLLCCSTCWLMGQAPQPSAPSVTDLVNQLGSSSFRARETATKQLLEQGEQAVAPLTAALKHRDYEIRRRAEEILGQLTRQLDSALQTKPKLVKLDYKAQAINNVLADFKAKTGIPVKMEWPAGADQTRLVTVHTAELTPWEAFDALLEQAGLKEVFREEVTTEKTSPYAGYGYTPPLSPSSVPVWVTEGKATKLSGDRSSAVRVMVLPPTFSGHRIIRGSGQLKLALDVTPLASLGWNEVTSVQLSRAEEESGRPVTLSHRPASENINDTSEDDLRGRFFGGRVAFFRNYNYGYDSTPSQANTRLTSVMLRTNDRTMKKLRLFEGKVIGQVMLTNQVLGTVADMTKTNEKTIQAGTSTTISVVGYNKRPNGSVAVKIRQEMPSQWQMNQFGGMMRSYNPPDGNQFKYFDAEGKPVPQPYNMGSSASDDGMRYWTEVEWIFDKKTTNGPPVKLVVMGNKPKTLEIPFRLTDVILP